MLAEISTLLTTILYGMASALGLWGLTVSNKTFRSAGYWLSIAAFIFQTLILLLGFHHSHAEGLSVGAYFQLIAWFIMPCCLWLAYHMKQHSLIILAAPLCFMLFLLSGPWLDTIVVLPQKMRLSFYVLHVGALLLALALIFLGSISAVLFLVLEKRIKRKFHGGIFWQAMPALSVLDRINSLCALLAFPFFTVGLLTGLFWSPLIYATLQLSDPKAIISLIIWLFLAILFHNRLAGAWKGKKPARFILIILSLALFSVLAVNWLMHTSHSFLRS